MWRTSGKVLESLKPSVSVGVRKHFLQNLSEDLSLPEFCCAWRILIAQKKHTVRYISQRLSVSLINFLRHSSGLEVSSWKSEALGRCVRINSADFVKVSRTQHSDHRAQFTKFFTPRKLEMKLTELRNGELPDDTQTNRSSVHNQVTVCVPRTRFHLREKFARRERLSSVRLAL